MSQIRLHSRSSSRGSRRAKRKNEKQKKGQVSRKKQSKFRTGVAVEQVDQLLKDFIKRVKQGLALLLSEPSELSQKVLKQNPQWAVNAEQNLVLVTWAAYMAWEKPWEEFCQMVIADPAWQELLGGPDQASLTERQAQFEEVIVRLIELALHDALKAGDKKDNRAAADKGPVEDQFTRRIGVAQVLKRLKKRIKGTLKKLDKADKSQQGRCRAAHRARDYRTSTFILADLMRWLLQLPSTDGLIRELEDYSHLAGAVNFTPGVIPNKSTFSRRRQLIPIEELLAILHELVQILIKYGEIDGRAWLIDLMRVPTNSSVKKNYPDSPNNKSDPEAEFCGYRDNGDGLQLGYSLLLVTDFKSELPFSFLFAKGGAHDAPWAEPTLQQALDEQPVLAKRCTYVMADGSYDNLAFFAFVLNKLKAMPVVTKNPRGAKD